MNNVSKERLVIELHQAAIEANKIDSNILGVILFGSRVRPDWHPYGPRPDSDVDLMPVCRRGLPESMFVFPKILHSRLDTLSLKGDIAGAIRVDEGIPFSDPIFALLDEYSLGITVDEFVNRKILEYTKTLEGEGRRYESLGD